MPMVRPKMTKEEIVIELTPHVHGYLDLAAITPALSQLSSHGDTVAKTCWIYAGLIYKHWTQEKEKPGCTGSKFICQITFFRMRSPGT